MAIIAVIITERIGLVSHVAISALWSVHLFPGHQTILYQILSAYQAQPPAVRRQWDHILNRALIVLSTVLVTFIALVIMEMEWMWRLLPI